MKNEEGSGLTLEALVFVSLFIWSTPGPGVQTGVGPASGAGWSWQAGDRCGSSGHGPAPHPFLVRAILFTF